MFWQRIKALYDRYQRQTTVAVGVLLGLTFLLSQIIPEVQTYVQTSGLLQYLEVLLLLDIALLVSPSNRRSPFHVTVNQEEALPKLLAAVQQCRFSRSKSVDLLEYAGQTTKPLIEAALREGLHVRLLVQHPEMIQGPQFARTITVLDTIFNRLKKHPGQIEVRCYRLPYGLRARRIGKSLLELGWLTPDTEGQSAFGGENPSLLSEFAGSSSDQVEDFFETTFSQYWDDEGTEDGRAVFTRLVSRIGPALMASQDLSAPSRTSGSSVEHESQEAGS